jgi:DNA-directed RNA polymerase alpha subunit
MPAGPVWTPYEDERLRTMALSGASAATIARQMNRSEQAVRKRAVRLNVVLAKRAQAQAQGEGEMSERHRHMLDPTPELPNDTPIDRVRFPARIQNVLVAAGLKTVGEVRETSDETLLSFQDFGKGSVARLRETQGG